MKALLTCLISIVLFAAPASAENKLFTLGGQSNADGNGDSSLLPGELAIIPANCEVWVSGVRINSFHEVRTFGPEVSLIHALSARYPDDYLIFVKFAVGSTSLYAWSPTWSPETAAIAHDVSKGPLYPRLMRYVQKAVDGRDVKYCGTWWMQGERDAKFEIPAKEYGRNLKRLVLALRRNLGGLAPFVFGVINPPIQENRAYVYQVIQEQITFPRRTVQVHPVSTHGLTKEGTLHYDGPGGLELGRRFFDAMPK